MCVCAGWNVPCGGSSCTFTLWEGRTQTMKLLVEVAVLEVNATECKTSIDFRQRRTFQWTLDKGQWKQGCQQITAFLSLSLFLFHCPLMWPVLPLQSHQLAAAQPISVPVKCANGRDCYSSTLLLRNDARAGEADQTWTCQTPKSLQTMGLCSITPHKSLQLYFWSEKEPQSK